MSFAPGHWPVVAISLGFLLSALVLLGLARRPGITCQQMLPVCSCLWKHSQARTSQFGGLTSSQWAIPDNVGLILHFVHRTFACTGVGHRVKALTSKSRSAWANSLAILLKAGRQTSGA